MRRVQDLTHADMKEIDTSAALYSLVYAVERILALNRLQCKNAKCTCVQCDLVKQTREQIARAKEVLEREA